jgi:hypothetical protein
MQAREGLRHGDLRRLNLRPDRGGILILYPQYQGRAPLAMDLCPSRGGVALPPSMRRGSRSSACFEFFPPLNDVALPGDVAAERRPEA